MVEGGKLQEGDLVTRFERVVGKPLIISRPASCRTGWAQVEPSLTIDQGVEESRIYWFKNN